MLIGCSSVGAVWAGFGCILGASCATGKQRFSAAAVGARIAVVHTLDVELRGGQEAGFFRLRFLRLHITFVGAVAAPFTNSQPQLSREMFHVYCGSESTQVLHVILTCSSCGSHAHPSIAGASG